MKYLKKTTKTSGVAKMIDEAIELLSLVDIPTDGETERSLERMAMAFLAVAGIKTKWTDAINSRSLKTRDIITFNNENFEENISSGSYDDIRRKDLKMLVLAGLIINTAEKPDAATNDPTRGYCLETTFMNLVHTYGTSEWDERLKEYKKNSKSLKEQLQRNRDIEKIPIILPNKTELIFSKGAHNDLQKAIIEEFLPRYGKGCEILYVGDTANKSLHLEKQKLESIKFFELSHDKLPDIVAYDSQKNWLYLIEAVHSSGAINEIRLLELKKLTEECKASIIYVTAFLNRAEFRKWSSEIAWETEVWVADNPDHLIHFNGDKFLGPYSEKK